MPQNYQSANIGVSRSNDTKSVSFVNNGGRGGHATMHLSGLTHRSDNTAAITVGVTDEMGDSVHSLMPRQNYYEWKNDLAKLEPQTNSSSVVNESMASREHRADTFQE